MMIWDDNDQQGITALIPMISIVMTTTTSNKWWSCSTRKIQHFNFYKHTKTLALKTEAKMSCSFHECPYPKGMIIIKWRTITLNQKNEPLYLLEVNDNVSAQDRPNNSMLFAWLPLITSFYAKDVNTDTSWMGYHFQWISVNFWICGMHSTPLKSASQYSSIEVLASEFQASLTLQKQRCL